MLSHNQIKLNQAIDFLKKGQIVEFGQNLIALHEQLTCHCFTTNQKANFFEDLLPYIENLADQVSDFYVNLAKGYIYLYSKEGEKAFEYLSLNFCIK